jgi:biofilm PGA synthesis lipoprotein PgaB
MRKLVIFCLFLYSGLVLASPQDHFITLCYHDIRNDLTDSLDTDQFAVSTDHLIAQFSWLKAHGYHVISIDDLVLAKLGIQHLPEKAVLLSFDDGYASVYHILFPLLKAFKYPAVVAVVGKWLQPEMGAMVRYGDRYLKPRKDFLTWEQIREMSDSGLVEIASHSFDLHRGILGNPQGNLQPAAATRRYDPASRSYADTQRYQQRIHDDLEQNSDVIAKHTGKRPRVMVWPYGEYSHEVIEIAEQLGMPYTMTLRDGRNHLADSKEIRRVLIEANPKLKQFVYTMEQINEVEPIRAIRVSLDSLYDDDPVRADANLGHLLDQIHTLKINTVYLQAVADRDGNGLADAAYFPNHHLPMVGDFFNRVEWTLETRAPVNVYAWMPFRSFELPDKHPVTDQVISRIYQDLAKSGQIDGILFYDTEPASRLADNNSSWLKQLTEQVKYYRPEIKTALAIQPGFDADTLSTLARCCHYLQFELPVPVTIDALQNLIALLPKAGLTDKTVIFELSKKASIAKQPQFWSQLRTTYRQLMQLKATQFSYFPLSGMAEDPGYAILKSTISLRQHPFGP